MRLRFKPAHAETTGPFRRLREALGGPHWKLRALILDVCPPILLRLYHVARERTRATRHSLSPSPDPRSYSTLTDPLEVPVQVECYVACRDEFSEPEDSVLDVGFGLGYGLQILSAKCSVLFGAEVDMDAAARGSRIFAGHPRIRGAVVYDGTVLPFHDDAVDLICCIEVLEHVEDYESLLHEMIRVARRRVVISTPNRLPQNTTPEGHPKNYWHLREWSFEELDTILKRLSVPYEWHFVTGYKDSRGIERFSWEDQPAEDTWSLVPILILQR